MLTKCPTRVGQHVGTNRPRNMSRRWAAIQERCQQRNANKITNYPQHKCCRFGRTFFRVLFLRASVCLGVPAGVLCPNRCSGMRTRWCPGLCVRCPGRGPQVSVLVDRHAAVPPWLCVHVCGYAPNRSMWHTIFVCVCVCTNALGPCHNCSAPVSTSLSSHPLPFDTTCLQGR